MSKTFILLSDTSCIFINRFIVIIIVCFGGRRYEFIRLNIQTSSLHVSHIVYCSLVKVNGTSKNKNFTLSYRPHTTTILDCYIDDTIHYRGVNPTWVVVTGSTTELHVTQKIDYITGNIIAEYTYVADDLTSQTSLECSCDCNQCTLLCHYPVVVTLEGMSVLFYK